MKEMKWLMNLYLALKLAKSKTKRTTILCWFLLSWLLKQLTQFHKSATPQKALYLFFGFFEQLPRIHVSNGNPSSASLRKSSHRRFSRFSMVSGCSNKENSLHSKALSLRLIIFLSSFLAEVPPLFFSVFVKHEIQDFAILSATDGFIALFYHCSSWGGKVI